MEHLSYLAPLMYRLLIKQYNMQPNPKYEDLLQQIDDLKRKQEFYQAIFNDSYDWEFLRDNNGEIIHISRGFERITGYSTDEILSGKVSEKDFVHPDDYETVVKIIQDTRMKGSVTDLHFRILRKDKQVCRVVFNAAALFRGEKFLGTRVSIKGITDKRDFDELLEVKKSIEECEERFRALHNASYGGIAIHDKGRILECNQGLSDITGYSYEELIGMEGLKLISPEHHDNVMQKIITGFDKPYESIGLRKNGNKFPIRIHGKDIPYKGKNVRVTEFIDLTELKQTEDILSRVIEHNPLSIQIIDAEGYTIKINPSHTRLFGAVPPNDYSVFPDKQIEDQGISSYFEMLRAGNMVVFPELFYNAHHVNPSFPDKSVWLKMIGFPLFGTDGKPQKFVLLHEDITQRKEAFDKLQKNETLLKQQNEEYLSLNEELRQTNEELFSSKEVIEESEMRLRAISNNLPNGLVYQLSSGYNFEKRQFSFISDGVERLHGFTVEEIMKNPGLMYDQIHEEDRQFVIDQEMYAARTFSMFRAEARFCLPNGKTEWRLLSSKPRKLPNGEIVWDGVEIDINERKIAEKALLESEEKFRFMVENLSDVVWHTDQNFIFTYISPSDEYIRGFAYNEVVGSPIWKFMKPEGIELIQKNNKKRISDEQAGVKTATMNYEIEYACKDGRWIWIEVTVSPFRNEAGELIGYHGISRDISERKNAELKQKQSEERLNLSLEVNNASLFENNFETGEVITTPQLYEYLGYSEDDLPKNMDSLLTFMHPDDVPVALQAVKDHFEGKTEDYYSQFRMKSKSGTWVWVEGMGKVVRRNTKGEPTVLVGISREIHAQKQAEIQLRQSQQQLQSFISHAPVVLFAIDSNGIFTYSDGSGLAHLGLKPGQVVGMSALELYAAYPDVVENIKGALSGKVLAAVHDMGLVVFDTHYSPIFDEKGKIESIIGVATDITDRRKAELQIRTLGRAIEQSPSVIVITNAEGKIDFVNQKFIDFMQYTLEEVKGRPPRIFNPGHISHDIFTTMWDTLRGGNVWQGEFLNRKKDGTQFWENVTIAPITEIDGKTSNYILINEDITEKKHMLEELVEAKEKAEDSNRLKSAFLQNMSHEIRTPMNAIIGFSDMLSEPDLSEEKRATFTKIIQNSSQQLLSIVTDILTISALETKQEKVTIQPTSVNDIIVEQLSIFKLQAYNQNISLYSKQQLTDSRSVIFCDTTKLVQVISNLLTNALKFTHKGFIEFGYSLQEPEEGKQQYLLFFVKDSGIGIQPDALERIFERFSQADPSINRKYGGTGLGLAISKAFVELMGGKIWVESQPETGSTFYFTIPYNPVFTDIEPEVENSARSVSPTVLVAEDEEYNYLLIEEFLNRMNFNTIHSKDGKETVEICKKNPNVKLVLMDIKMPVMDGLTATKLIKELRPDLPVIAQSAYALEHEIKKYNAYGFDGYITKPLNKQKLMEVVERIK